MSLLRLINSKNSFKFFRGEMTCSQFNACPRMRKMQGKSLADALADGDVKLDENGNLVDKDGNPVTVVPGSGGEQGEMDNHDGWGDMDDETREIN